MLVQAAASFVRLTVQPPGETASQADVVAFHTQKGLLALQVPIDENAAHAVASLVAFTVQVFASVGQTVPSALISGTQVGVEAVNAHTDDPASVGPFFTFTPRQVGESVAATEQSPAAAPVKSACAPQVAVLAAMQAPAAVHAQTGAMQAP